ncbi:MAG: tyrosine-type recombinase/integrase [Planctomycetaceae bacterium]|nr:tyrosine-type recombinase/integrase [Planctomycetaceae bacterium]
MSQFEIGRLLVAARVGSSCGGLTGEQRYILYSTALTTGLRVSELASLTPAHFDLDGDSPSVTIHAADEKSRRGDVLPLHPEIVHLLRPVIKSLEQNERLWPGTWAERRHGNKMMRHDLDAARAAWLDDAETKADRDVRDRTDVLCYRDNDGKQADFHTLRHTFLSRLGRFGASPKVMQRLARHTSVELMLGRYTHANVYDLTLAINALTTIDTP